MVNKYETPNGKVRWQAIWRDEDGKQRGKSFDNEAEAVAFETRVIEEKVALENRPCARKGCDKMVIQARTGRRRKYCSDECSTAEKNRPGRPRHRAPRVPREPLECKLQECHELVPDNPRGRPKEFCCPEHRVLYWNRQMAKAKGPDPRHYITEADDESNTGTCSVCGQGVEIWSYMDKYEDGRPRKRYRCQMRGMVGRVDSHRAFDRSRLGWAAKIRNRYGLSIEEYDALVLAHEGRCAICSGELRHGQIDHDPKTEKVRGLLCSTCNTGLGKLGDDEAGIRRAADYLEAHT